MKLNRLTLTALALVLGVTAAFAQANVSYVKDQILVKYRANADSQVTAATTLLGAQTKAALSDIRWHIVKLPAGVTVENAMKYYASNKAVEAVAVDHLKKFLYTPNDPMYNQQYGPQKVNAPKAWDFSLGDPTVMVAVIDSGVDYTHSDLVGKILLGPDFGEGDNDPFDNVVGHGTHCAGIVGAKSNNNNGVASVGFNTMVKAYKIATATGGVSTSASVQSIIQATKDGCAVLSMSYGGYGQNQAESDAIKFAVANNVLPVAAAGNDGINQTLYPAGYSGVLAVAASDRNDNIAGFSNFGNWVQVAAPGVGILSTVKGNGYEAWDGTSMATPLVAGSAGLLKSYAPSATALEIKAALEDTAVNIGNKVTKGRIDVAAAMTRLIVPIDVVANGQNPAMVQGSSAVGGSGAVANSDGVTYDIRSLAVAGLGGVAAGSADLSITRPASKYLSGSLTIAASAQANATLSVYLWNYNSGGGSWELLKSVNVGSGSTTVSLSLPSITNYLKNNATKILVRTVLPERLSRASYALKVDRIALSAKFDPR